MFSLVPGVQTCALPIWLQAELPALRVVVDQRQREQLAELVEVEREHREEDARDQAHRRLLVGGDARGAAAVLTFDHRVMGDDQLGRERQYGAPGEIGRSAGRDRGWQEL